MLGINGFKKDPRYLLNTTLFRTFVLAGLLGISIHWTNMSWQTVLVYLIPILLLTANGVGSILLGLLAGIGISTYQFGFGLNELLFMVGAVVLTLPITSLFHSASHLSLRPRILNRVLGEIIGLWHNVGIDIWSVLHYYHHRHTDIVGLDPHPSLGKGFLAFTKDTGTSYGDAFKFHYFKIHGEFPRAQAIFKLISLNFRLRHPMVSLFWFLVLGPKAFVFFYGTNIFFKKIHYAWFNWATHTKVGENIETQNLDGGWYRCVNAISINLYYHQNHHKYPNLMNPKRVPAIYQKVEKDKVA